MSLVIESMKYLETPGQAQDGVITAVVITRSIVRYKWVPRKDGGGNFFASPGLKLPTSGGDKYFSGHDFDSSVDKEEFEKASLEKIKESQQKVSMAPQSVHATSKQPLNMPTPQFEEPIGECPF